MPSKFLTRPRLPVEVWSLIFSATLSSFHFDLPLLSPPSPLCTLTLVCKNWRNIIFSTPSLWSSFTIFVDATPRAAAMRHWLKRSGQVPLYIDITTDRKSNMSSVELTDSMDDIVKVLAPHRRRLRRLHIHGPCTMEAFNGDPMSALEDLSVQSRGFHGQPTLNTLIALPLGRLKHLRLEVHADQLLTLDECAIILSKATRLEHCYIDAICTGSLSIIPFSCAALKSLNLLLRSGPETHPNCNLISFFQAMEEVPLLEHLGVDWLVPGDARIGELPSILTRLSPSLRSLRFSYVPLSDHELSECLEGLTNLESVYLRYSLCGPNDPITSTLLQTLKYRRVHLECTGEGFSDDDLVEMLEGVESCYLLTPHRRSETLYKLQEFFQLEHVYP